MFCEEDMIKREVSWVGFGFQVWLQLLTYVVKFSDSDMLIVDEPEIYLHPDLQHKILNILKAHKSTVLLATHSVEIINDVEPSDVILIDKKRQTAKRINDLKGLQEVANILGSGSNIHLTRLARGKKILFVEGEDLKILKKLAALSGFNEIFSTGEITVVPINGFSQYEKIINANWAFSKVLGQELVLSVLLDRDYRCIDEVEEIKKLIGENVKYINILERKEIENYLIIPDAIERSINERMKTKSSNEVFSVNIHELLYEITNQHKNDTLAQISANAFRFKQSKGIALATIISEENNRFENLWSTLEKRILVAPGKSILANLNTHLQEHYGISITTTLIISKMKKNDLPEDIISFFSQLEEIRTRRI